MQRQAEVAEQVPADPLKPNLGPPRRRRRWVWVVLLLCAAGFAAYKMFPPGRKAASGNGKPARAAGAAARPVAVVAAPAKKTDMPVYLNGLGSVSAYNTVPVRSRVDGELMKVGFEEGQMVKQGDMVAEIDPRPFQAMVALAEGQLGRDQAFLANAKVDLERYRGLYDQNALPKQQLDTQSSTVTQYEAIIKSDQAQVDTAKLNLQYCRILAPLSGRIGFRLVDRGSIVHANDPTGLAVVTQLQPIFVVFNIGEDQIPQVTRKMKSGASLPVIAWDRDFKHKLAVGKLFTIDNQIDQASGTVRFKAVFENRDQSLFPNQFVNARLLVDTRKNAVVIPSGAIQHSPASDFVYVVKKDNTVAVRNVVSSTTEGDESAIEKGLAAGEVVVVEGIDKLQQGSKVAVRMIGSAPKA